MDDNELIDALRTGLDAVDPPPPSLLAKALAAGNWPSTPAVDTARTAAESVGAGMRSSVADDGGSIELVRDLTFEGAGHTVSITLDFDQSDGAPLLDVIISPRVDIAHLVSPFGQPIAVEFDDHSRVSLRVEDRAAALEFIAESGDIVRTPLIRLY